MGAPPVPSNFSLVRLMSMIVQRCLAASSVLFAAVAVASPAAAQVGGQWGWNPMTGGTGTSYGTPPTQPYQQPYQPTSARKSSDVEIGSLYGAAAMYGVGTGVWIDAEAGIKDPGLRFIAPIILGVGGPVGVYFLDQPALNRGIPASITAGMAIGAGEGFGLWSYQFVRSDSKDSWGFKGFARATFIGATVGGAAGAAVGFLQEPSPKTSILLGSASLWGASIGSMFGYGASEKGIGYGRANDSASVGGLIGYNVGLLGAAGLSTVYVPSEKALVWMWAGAGIGFVGTLPVYLFYAGSDSTAKRGLIVQGVGTSIGLAAGAIFTLNDRDTVAEGDRKANPFAKITSVGPMPLPGGGMGGQIAGTLF
jgi:hypothetical protein